MLFLLLLSYFLNQFIKLSANIVMPIYQTQFGLSSGTSGLISSMFFLSYAFMQIASGPLCKKIGSGKLVGTGMIVAGLGLLLMGTATGALSIIVGRFLMGLGLGTVFICVIDYIAHKYSGKTYVTVSALALAVSSFGSASAAAPLKYMVDNLGTSYSLLVLAGICTLIGILFLAFYSKSTHINTDSESLFKQIVGTCKYIITNKNLILGMLIWIIFLGVQMTYQGLWCTKWTVSSFPIMANFSGLTGTVMGFGLMCGCFFGKYIKPVKFTFRESSLLHGFFFLLSLSLLCIVNMTEFFWLSVISNAIFGFCCGSLCTHDTAFCREASSVEQNATVMGIWNSLASLFVMIYQWGSGVIVDSLQKVSHPFSWTHLIMGSTFLIVYIFAFFEGKKTK